MFSSTAFSFNLSQKIHFLKRDFVLIKRKRKLFGIFVYLFENFILWVKIAFFEEKNALSKKLRFCYKKSMIFWFVKFVFSLFGHTPYPCKIYPQHIFFLCFFNCRYFFEVCWHYFDVVRLILMRGLWLGEGKYYTGTVYHFRRSLRNWKGFQSWFVCFWWSLTLFDH